MAVVNIAETGVVFRGEITLATAEIIDHGFVWSSSQSLDLTKVDKIGLGPKTSAGVFDGEVGFGLAQGVKYYFRAFVQSKTHIVYGETLEFVSLGSLAPVIEDFAPKEATWYDTITLIGKNFAGVVKFGDKEAEIILINDRSLKVRVPLDNVQPETFISVVFSGNSSVSRDKLKLKSPIISQLAPLNGKFGDVITIKGNYFHPFQTKVKFDEINAELTILSSSQIVCKVPSGLQRGLVHVEVISGVQNVRTQDIFTYEAPVINEITPSEGTYGDLITIKGNDFGSQPGDNVVKFEGEVAEIVSSTSTEIVVRVPETIAIQTSTVEVIFNQQTSRGVEFSLLPPMISDFSPKRGTVGTEVIITGNRFSPILENNRVTLGGIDSEIISASVTQLNVIVPDVIVSHELKLTVESSGSKITADNNFKSPWAQVANAPNNSGVIAFITIDENLFVFTNNSGDNIQFYRFVNDTGTWERKSDAPISFYLGWGFSFDGKAYIGTSNDPFFFEYDPIINIWTQKNDVPFDTSPLASNTIGISNSNSAYALNNQNELWKYNQSSDTWQQQSNYPDMNYLHGNAIGDDLLVMGYNQDTDLMQIWIYNTVSMNWISYSIPPEIEQLRPYDIAYFYGGVNKLYLGVDNNSTFENTLESAIWTQGVDIIGPSIYQRSLPLSNSSSKIYIITSNGVLEFDPDI